jgi:alpha-L-fucosidase
MYFSRLQRRRSKRPEFAVLAGLLILLSSVACRQVDPPPPVGPVPSAAQLAWHEMEMNAFIHFTINTFTDREWGDGSESPSLFSPSGFDAGQWVDVLKRAGFKGVILTCKHHDGFCLWPTQFTSHSVKSSPFMNGDGDVVGAVANECKTNGLKFGVYLSPWDRNHPDYGTPGYVQYYRSQLKELFDAYGPVFEMWFDGANGGTGFYGGKAETRRIDGSTYYDWPGTIGMVKQLQEDIIFFSDAGPGVRWVGNERGVAGETNWNTITTDTLFAGKAGIEKLLNTGHENGTSWVPAETDVSIRPGWFYHEKEDSLVKSPERLFEIYLTSVGRGSTLLLNVPPDRRGRLHENDVASLAGFRRLLDEAFDVDLALNAPAVSSSVRGDESKYSAQSAVDGDKETYWTTDDGVNTGFIELNLQKPQPVQYVLVQEFIRLGQRVKAFEVLAETDGKWHKVGEGTTIGYKRILVTDKVVTSKLRLEIRDSKACPLISALSVY